MRISFILGAVFLAIPLFIISCTAQPNPTATQTLTAQKLTPIPPPTLTPTLVYVIEEIAGSFRNQIGHLEKDMPRADSEGYVVPSEKEQKDFAKLISLLKMADPAGAARIAVENNYTLINYADRGDENAVSYLLREQKPIQKGWGLYAFRMDSTSSIIIEAPHPLYDRRTPSVALDIYRALDARALLIAGAHRNANSDGSADMAHTTESIFHSIHVTLLEELKPATGDLIILQIHGFHTNKHEGYPQAVFGFGKKMEGKEFTVAKKLESAFSAQGINAGLCTGDVWQDLCGTKNAQASVASGGIFIHIELDENLRKHDDPLIAALVQVFGNRLSP